MKQINLFIFLLIIAYSQIYCTNSKEKESNISITIMIGQSYYYDLDSGIFKVNQLLALDSNKREIGWKTFNFQLTKEEKLNITKKYYELGLDYIVDNADAKQPFVLIKNSCPLYDPIIYTNLEIKTSSQKKTIRIDENCKNYSIFNNEGQKVALFLKYIYTIVKRKKQIKLAPKSTMIYY